MDVKDAISTRRSVRLYKADIPSRELINELVDAARLAPTAVNKQPFRLICVTSADLLAKLQESYKRDWIKTAPCIFIVVAEHDKSWHRGLDGKDHADIDAAIATDHITLRATELGLGTCWVCNFDAQKVHTDFNLGEQEEAVVLLPVGYEADEAKEKVRREISEVVTFL